MAPMASGSFLTAGMVDLPLQRHNAQRRRRRRRRQPDPTGRRSPPERTPQADPGAARNAALAGPHRQHAPRHRSRRGRAARLARLVSRRPFDRTTWSISSSPASATNSASNTRSANAGERIDQHRLTECTKQTTRTAAVTKALNPSCPSSVFVSTVHCVCACCVRIAVLKTIRHLLELIRFSHTLFALPFALLAAVMAWRLQGQMYQHECRRSLCRPLRPSCGPRELGSLERDVCKRLTTRVRTWSLDSLARSRRHPALHGHRPQLRDGVESPGRPQTRRGQSAHRRPPSAGRHSQRDASHRIRDRLRTSAFVASTLLFLPNRLPLYLVGSRARISCRLQLHQAVHLARPLLARHRARPVAGRRLDRHSRRDSVLPHPADLLPALVLGGAVLTWVAGFDIIYACQDYESDRRARLPQRSRPLGIPGALRLAAACHLLTIVAPRLPAARLSVLRLDLLGSASPPSPCCSFTSICSCGRTTFPA